MATGTAYEHIVLGIHDLKEFQVSDCPYGCKFYKCSVCDYFELIHNRAYGCKEATCIP